MAAYSNSARLTNTSFCSIESGQQPAALRLLEHARAVQLSSLPQSLIFMEAAERLDQGKSCFHVRQQIRCSHVQGGCKSATAEKRGTSDPHGTLSGMTESAVLGSSEAKDACLVADCGRQE
jgi:hypothetical protein